MKLTCSGCYLINVFLYDFLYVMNIFFTAVFNSEINLGLHHIQIHMSDYNFIDSNISNLLEKKFSLFLKKPCKKGLNRDFMPWPIFCSLICPIKKGKI